MMLTLWKLEGPWLWMIAPTDPGKGGKDSIDIDSLDNANNGEVTENMIAQNGANEGDQIGQYKWTPGFLPGHRVDSFRPR